MLQQIKQCEMCQGEKPNVAGTYENIPEQKENEIIIKQTDANLKVSHNMEHESIYDYG